MQSDFAHLSRLSVMGELTAEQVQEKVDAVYRSESRRILATLIRLLGDFELAEDATRRL